MSIKGWGPALCARRPDITMEMVHDFLTNMYTKRADFVFTVTRDFVRSCQTPILVLPDDVPAHPYAVAMETVRLAPKAEVSLYPWKEPKDLIPQAVRHVRELPPGASTRDCRPLRQVGWRTSTAPPFPPSSTVSKLLFAYVQWSQEVTLFPVIEACKFVALQTLLPFMQQA